MNIDAKLFVHDTDPDLYAAFVRFFGENEAENTRWVEFVAEGVRVTFFAKDAIEPASVKASPVEEVAT